MKTTKRILATFLVILMLVTSVSLAGLDSIFTLTAEAANSDYKVGDHIQYGNYPQSRITDSSTLSLLDSITKNWISYKYYSDSKPADYMYYADLDTNGDGKRDYRAVKFDKYRPWLGGDTATDNYLQTYQPRQDFNGYSPNTVYYFEYEPISWRILDPQSGLIMSEVILDSQAYNNFVLYGYGSKSGSYEYYGNSAKTHYANDYYNSSIRKWLNEEFYNTAFNASQAANIRNDVLLNNDCWKSSSYYNSQASRDKIFLLSYDEVKTSSYGFAASPEFSDTARQAAGSAYAGVQGLFIYPGDWWYLEYRDEDEYNGFSEWWLRSPYTNSEAVCSVDKYGNCDQTNYVDISDTSCGVRPACRLSQLKTDVSKSDINNNNIGDYKVGDLIEYGNYPQSRVTDSSTLSLLYSRTKNWISYKEPDDYMYYADLDTNGDGKMDYRAVKFDKPRSYDQADRNGYLPYRVYYFKYEPILWRILDPQSGLVMSETILDSQPYNNFILYGYGSKENRKINYGDSAMTYCANDYYNSSIRKWLNEEFYNTAFTASQAANIRNDVLLNNDYLEPLTSSVPYRPQDSKDKIFLLSYDEVETPLYGFAASRNSSEAVGSDYAKAQGLYFDSDDGLSYWWLRTPYEYSSGGKAYLSSMRPSAVEEVDNGIRPACRLSHLKSDSNNNISDYKVGDRIQYGNYPQSRITDSSTLSLLDSETKNWISYKYYSGSGSSDDGQMKPADYMYYADLDTNGDGKMDYRAVKFDKYIQYDTGGTAGGSSTYQDNNGYSPNTVYYFKYEPILWRILDPQSGLIMSETILDSQPYNNFVLRSGEEYYGDSAKTHYANDYYNSSIRKWLNEEFYNTAFTASQAANIRNDVSLNNNCCESSYTQYNSPGSKDKIFLLSYDEAENPSYGFKGSPVGYDDDTARQATGSDYAKAQGLYFDSDDGLSYWWLRSSYSSSNRACLVDYDGCYYNCFSNVNKTSNGVRPACRLSQLKSDSDNIGGYKVGDHIEYGNYPQTRVTDSSTLSLLDSTTKNWISYKYYSGSGSSDDGQMKPADYMYYADLDTNGDGKRDYRAVKFDKYRQRNTGGTAGGSSTNQEDNVYSPNTVYYFKYEPISWRILDPQSSLIMSETILDSQPYNNFVLRSGKEYYGDSAKTYYANDYYNSSIRKWLNEEFYNTAFTASQAANIRNDVSLNNDCRESSYTQYNSQASKDKIFLLSYDEVKNPSYGFVNVPVFSDTARQATGSDYAKAQGLDFFSNNRYSPWWLRSSDNSSNRACLSNYGRSYNLYGVANETDNGVRPACRLSQLKSDVSKSDINNNRDTSTVEPIHLSYDLTPKTYNGKAQGVSVTSKDGEAITVYYTGVGETVYKKSTTPPINTGSYAVTVDIAANNTHGNIIGTSLGTFTINSYVTMRVGRVETINNGKKTTLDNLGTKPFILNGRTMVPMRFIGEKMGGKVVYVNASKPITMTYGTKQVDFTLGSKTIKLTDLNTKKSQTISIDVPAQIKNSKTYIPLRAISQALGFSVYYQSGTQYIVINTPTMSDQLRDERLEEARKVIK